MAWCSQAASHYLSQCWPRSLLPYGVTRPQWVDFHEEWYQLHAPSKGSIIENADLFFMFSQNFSIYKGVKITSKPWIIEWLVYHNNSLALILLFFVWNLLYDPFFYLLHRKYWIVNWNRALEGDYVNYTSWLSVDVGDDVEGWVCSQARVFNSMPWAIISVEPVPNHQHMPWKNQNWLL